MLDSMDFFLRSSRWAWWECPLLSIPILFKSVVRTNFFLNMVSSNLRPPSIVPSDWQPILTPTSTYNVLSPRWITVLFVPCDPVLNALATSLSKVYLACFLLFHELCKFDRKCFLLQSLSSSVWRSCIALRSAYDSKENLVARTKFTVND